MTDEAIWAFDQDLHLPASRRSIRGDQVKVRLAQRLLAAEFSMARDGSKVACNQARTGGWLDVKLQMYEQAGGLRIQVSDAP